MAPPVEVLTNLRAPCAWSARRTLTVPSTLMRESLAGSATDLRTSIWAARWKTASGRACSTAAVTASSSPLCRRASTRFEPMKPAPPVTRVLMRRRMLVGLTPLLGSPRMRGLFVTFEGIDRSGKTTQARMLVDALGSAAVGVREPGGTPAAERIRDLLKDSAVPLSVETEALLFAAARAEIVANVIRPALSEGKVVASDRYLDSSLAYQGGARRLGVDEVERINRFATGGLTPDLTFLLDLLPSAAASRAGESDRFEDEGSSLQEAVLDTYSRLMSDDPARWRRIDASRAPEEIHAEVLAEVEAVRSGARA